MRRFNRVPLLGLIVGMAAASTVWAQSQYIGYVYPAGGQQGSTFSIRIGGQSLRHPDSVIVTGEGVSCRLVDYYKVFDNQELAFLRQQLNELKNQKKELDDVLAAKMASFEFPAPIGPPVDETVQNGSAAKPQPPQSEKEIARQKLIERIEKRFAEDERLPAVRSQTELIFVEVTVDPDAKPGRREIRVVTKLGISNPLPFFIGQAPEVARKPMKTCQLPILGKEYLAQRYRPPEEVELRIAVPCTLNGQIAPGEMNRYRFQASKGQRLVISAKARDLVPYVADGVPGWFQAVMRVHDANGRELAYSDDFYFHPDPLIFFEVPDDGEYVLTINEALFRGRESFVYRITIGELPFIASIFPLGGPVGAPVKIETLGWNLEKTTIAPPKETKPGQYLIAATNGNVVSNQVPFALDTLPECFDQEPNDEPAKAQKVALPIIVNGRSDRPGDWDVFAISGKAGETIVVEVHARRLGSPLDSFVKVTTADGKIIALNDDHYDAGSGFNTDHADSYLMAKLPADGTYYVHLGDTRRQAGKEYAYRLRISAPQPDFALRVAPSRICIPKKQAAAVTVFAIRKDGFDGPITLAFKDLPKGLESPGATLAPKQEAIGLVLKTTLDEMEKPINVVVTGTAKVGDREIVREAVPAEDRMQAFLWRHLMPAETLPVLVFNPGYQPPADRIRPPIRDEDRPKNLPRNLTRGSVDWYLRQLDGLYQDWFLTDEFVNREIANVEARLIQ